jgi:hypothetical protein
MLRAPLFPVELLSGIPESGPELVPWLKDLWNDPFIREGLTLGSHEFSGRIGQALNEPQPSRVLESLLYPILRYVCRFSTRSTPFGTFAGFTMGEMGSHTNVQLGERIDHQVHARPDMEFLVGIARILEADRDIREKLTFTPNSSLYRVGSRWHYVEVKIPGGSSRKVYDIITIEDNAIIGDVLSFSETGQKLDSIRGFLVNAGWDAPGVWDFVNSLVDSQVLVSELEPVVCGREYLDCLIRTLAGEEERHEIFGMLARLRDMFASMKRPTAILAGMPQLDPLIASVPVHFNRNHLVQVDLKLCHDSNQLDAELSGQMLLGLRILKSLSKRDAGDPLKGFREAFQKRYGDRKVLLVKALDPETGIGLEGAGEAYWTDPLPWIDDLRWGPSFSANAVEGNPGHPWLAGKYLETLQKGQIYISLESSDLQEIKIHEGDWPVQMSAMAELFESGRSGALNIHLLHGSGGHPAYLLGRFGFTDPEATQTWVSEMIRDEKASDPEAIFAEVVHLPEDRTGNILQRPGFLEYEIPYLARSIKDKDHQIPVSDLVVFVGNQKIVLSSAATGKRIQPRMTNAYNHQLGNLAIYKFLHRYQIQDSDGPYRPDWGDMAIRSPFIPGIRFKNLILSAPVWKIRCEELAHWMHPEKNVVDLAELTAWKDARKMPDQMLWISSDQELYFNWKNPSLILALWDTIRNLSSVRVRPFFLTGGTPVKGPDGSYANQVILCYRKS